jgi:hypothetical protein
VTALRIDVVDRSSAVELSRRLSSFRTYLVQSGRESWFVAVDPDGDPDAVTAGVLETVQKWLADGGSECVVHHGERTYPLRLPTAF